MQARLLIQDIEDKVIAEQNDEMEACDYEFMLKEKDEENRVMRAKNAKLQAMISEMGTTQPSSEID